MGNLHLLNTYFGSWQARPHLALLIASKVDIISLLLQVRIGGLEGLVSWFKVPQIGRDRAWIWMRGLVATASALTTRPLVCQQRYNEKMPAFSQGSKLPRASMSNSRQLKQGMWPVSLTCLPEGSLPFPSSHLVTTDSLFRFNPWSCRWYPHNPLYLRRLQENFHSSKREAIWWSWWERLGKCLGRGSLILNQFWTQ